MTEPHDNPLRTWALAQSEELVEQMCYEAWHAAASDDADAALMLSDTLQCELEGACNELARSWMRAWIRGRRAATPSTLDELLELMRDGDPYVYDHRGNWRQDLPTFGGDEPSDTLEVWSWDVDRLLVGTCEHDVDIVSRESWDLLKPRTPRSPFRVLLNGLEIYDLDPQSSELWAVAGPPGWTGPIDPDNLPDGFRWVTDQEWQELCERDKEFAKNAIRGLGRYLEERSQS